MKIFVLYYTNFSFLGNNIFRVEGIYSSMDLAEKAKKELKNLSCSGAGYIIRKQKMDKFFI